MKAIILAAGSGTRMGRYTDNLPKGMLAFNGKPLLQWQIETLRDAGLTDIVVVTGYAKDKIEFEGIHTFHNADYATTNMVESLLCARSVLDDDVLVCYADILYTEQLVKEMMTADGQVIVGVDSAWKEYWRFRYGSTEIDLESLTVKGDKILEIGRPTETSEGLNNRYIGLIRFNKTIWPKVLELYDTKKSRQETWSQSGKSFQQGYMTDLLNELIQTGITIRPCITARQWLEFDTVEDYEKSVDALKTGTLKEIVEAPFSI